MTLSVVVNWIPSDESEVQGLESDLFRFRQRYPAVTFTRDPNWTSGPGSDQWPAVRIESESLPAFQSAVREFACGDNLVGELHEEWDFNLSTGRLDQASFQWTQPDGTSVGTDVINAE